VSPLRRAWIVFLSVANKYEKGIQLIFSESYNVKVWGMYNFINAWREGNPFFSGIYSTPKEKRSSPRISLLFTKCYLSQTQMHTHTDTHAHTRNRVSGTHTLIWRKSRPLPSVCDGRKQNCDTRRWHTRRTGSKQTERTTPTHITLSFSFILLLVMRSILIRVRNRNISVLWEHYSLYYFYQKPVRSWLCISNNLL